jgi:hypothetical protein
LSSSGCKSQKTRLIGFGRYAQGNARKQGREPETFAFLGFTHICARSRKGKFAVHVKTLAKRFRRGLKAIGEWCQQHRHEPVSEQQKMLNAKLRGHYQYYGRPTNYRSLWHFYRKVRRMWRMWLSRCTRGKPLTWERYAEILSDSMFSQALEIGRNQQFRVSYLDREAKHRSDGFQKPIKGLHEAFGMLDVLWRERAEFKNQGAHVSAMWLEQVEKLRFQKLSIKELWIPLSGLPSITREGWEFHARNLLGRLQRELEARRQHAGIGRTRILPYGIDKKQSRRKRPGTPRHIRLCILPQSVSPRISRLI